MLSFIPGWLLSPIIRLIESSDTLSRLVNRIAINAIVKRARSRPHAHSTVHPYTSWTALTDKKWSARHLPAQPRTDLPEIKDLLPLFARRDEPQVCCPKSTCLFPAFAQYLTDGFLRTETDEQNPERNDVRRNTSNHEIDLCTLYGRNATQTNALRLMSEDRKGRLKSQMINGEEFPPFLFKNDKIDPQFAELDPPLGLKNKLEAKDRTLRAKLFAVGGDRVNSTPQVSMINTLFLREHNRIAGVLETQNPNWDDTRVFEVARNIVIVLFIKIVVEDYINHISPAPFKLMADPSVAWKATWNKPNWITTEFSLLYRWHGLIPDTIAWNDMRYPVGETFMQNDHLIKAGLLRGFQDMSGQRASALGPFGTPEPLLGVEERSIHQGRVCDLASYSEYRKHVGLLPPSRFEDITSDPDAAQILRACYKSPADVEFFVGLFAEDRVENSPLPELILRMVAIDAFSQALTNPLLSEHVFKWQTFSPYGWKLIEQTSTLRDVLARNIEGEIGDMPITMSAHEARLI